MSSIVSLAIWKLEDHEDHLVFVCIHEIRVLLMPWREDCIPLEQEEQTMLYQSIYRSFSSSSFSSQRGSIGSMNLSKAYLVTRAALPFDMICNDTFDWHFRVIRIDTNDSENLSIFIKRRKDELRKHYSLLSGNLHLAVVQKLNGLLSKVVGLYNEEKSGVTGPTRVVVEGAAVAFDADKGM